MRGSKKLYPCFLPDDYRDRLKRYQADIDSSIESDEAKVGTDVQLDPAGEETAEADCTDLLQDLVTRAQTEQQPE